MACFGVLIVLGSLLFVGTAMQDIAERRVLGDLYRAAQGRKVRPQFTLADMLGLFVQVQVLLAAIYCLMPGGGKDRATAMGLGVSLSFVLWGRAVQRLTAAGIRRASHRFCFTGLVYPGMTLGALGGPLLLVFMAIGVLLTLAGEGGGDALVIGSPLFLGGLVLMLRGCARFGRHIVWASRREEAGNSKAGAAVQTGAGPETSPAGGEGTPRLPVTFIDLSQLENTGGRAADGKVTPEAYGHEG